MKRQPTVAHQMLLIAQGPVGCVIGASLWATLLVTLLISGMVTAAGQTSGCRPGTCPPPKCEGGVCR